MGFSKFKKFADEYLIDKPDFKDFNIAPYMIARDGKGGFIEQFRDTAGRIIDKTNLNFDAIVAKFFREWGLYLEQCRLLYKALYYIADEPPESEIPYIKDIAMLARKGDPRIRIASTINLDKEIIDPDGRSLLDIRIPHIENSAQITDLTKQAYWIYDTIQTVLINMSGEANRILPWKAWQYGAKGILYYCANYWDTANVWKQPNFSWKGYKYYYGNGFFYYPPDKNGQPAGVMTDKIVPSIRWELMREGTEDYEYFVLIKNIDKAASLLEKINALPSMVNVYHTITGIYDGGNIKLGNGWRLYKGAGGSDKVIYTTITPGVTAGNTEIVIPNLRNGYYGLSFRIYQSNARRASRFCINGIKYDYIPAGENGYQNVRLPDEFEAKDNKLVLNISAADDNSAVYIIGLFVNGDNVPDIYSIRAEIGDFINSDPDNDGLNNYQEQILGTDPANPDSDTLTYSSSSLPQGAVFDASTRTFTWTPTYEQAGSYNVIFTVSDGAPSSDETITITVNNINMPPLFNPVSDTVTITEATENLNYKLPEVSASYGQKPTYILQGKPSWLDYNEHSHHLTGKAPYDSQRNYILTWTASDSEESAVFTLNLKINDKNRPPLFNAIDNKEIKENQKLEFNISAVDPEAGPLSYSVNNLPSGAVFTDNRNGTAIFAWTPSYEQAGSYNITFMASDGAHAVSKAIHIKVNNVNRAPVLYNIDTKTVSENEKLQFTVSASAPDSDALAYSAANLPDGAVFDPVRRTFGWTPNYEQAGRYLVGFKISDGEFFADQDVIINVNNSAKPPEPAPPEPASVQTYTRPAVLIMSVPVVDKAISKTVVIQKTAEKKAAPVAPQAPRQQAVTKNESNVEYYQDSAQQQNIQYNSKSATENVSMPQNSISNSVLADKSVVISDAPQKAFKEILVFAKGGEVVNEFACYKNEAAGQLIFSDNNEFRYILEKAKDIYKMKEVIDKDGNDKDFSIVDKHILEIEEIANDYLL